MARVVKSTIIDAPVDRVWAILRDFNGHDRWHPGVKSSAIERHLPSDLVGCVRRFQLQDGSELREQLLALSDLEMTFSYCLLDTPIPLFNYVAHVRLLPVTDGNRTFWHWECRFTTPAGREAEMANDGRRADLRGGLRGDPPPRGAGRMSATMTVQVKTFGSMSEAAAALASDRAARFFSGGTLLMRAINEGDTTIATLVRSTDPGYRQIRNEGARIAIGAGVRMVDILASRDLAFLHPVARVVGGPAVRAMATVGGNLFAPSPYGDLAVALLALDATVMVQGAYGGAQQTPLEQFLAGRDRAGSGGLVMAVSVPRPASPDAFRFRKVARVKPKGVSVLSIAAHLPVTGGRIAGARVAYGAMAPTPIRARAVERALEGRSLDAAGIAPALAAAAEGTSPATDALASAWYRREVVAIHLRRLLLGEGG